VSTDKKGTKILARTFFAQLRAGGYTPNQILDIATELIDLVTTDLKEADQARSAEAGSPENRLNA
jgi:pyruvate-formate lyase-activating enzyme